MSLIQHLANLVEGYHYSSGKLKKKNQDLKKIINRTVFNIEFRLESHKIELIKDYKDFLGKSNQKVARNLIFGTISDRIDNSIWWFQIIARIKKKKIFSFCSDDLPGIYFYYYC